MGDLPKFDIPGHVHFITTKTNRFMPLFLAHDFCRILLANVDFYRKKHNFKFLGYVIMPDHFHALIYPQNDTPIRKILGDIKRYAVKEIRERLMQQPKTWEELGGLVVPIERRRMAYQVPAARRYLRNFRVPSLRDFEVIKPRTKGQERQFWQEGFYDFNVYTEHKLHEKLSYMHNNPVVWRLVDDPADYPYSSYRNYFGGGDEGLPIEIDRF